MSELRRGRCIEALVRSGVSCGLLLSVFRGCYFVRSEFRKRADLLLCSLRRWSRTSDAILLTRFRSKCALNVLFSRKWSFLLEIAGLVEHLPQLLPVPLLSLRVPAHAQTRLADHRTDAFTSVSSAIVHHFLEFKTHRLTHDTAA